MGVHHSLEQNVDNIFVDFLILNFDKLQLDPKTSEKFNLVIEAQGYQHFTREGNMIGSQILKKKILEKKGLKVLMIPIWEWQIYDDQTKPNILK